MPVSLLRAGRSSAAALAIGGAPNTTTSIGASYVFTPDTSGGIPGYTYALTGTLPAGLSFNTATGAITGTPTTAQTKNGLDITVSDSHSPNPNTASLGAFSITVAASSSLAIMASIQTTATVGVAYGAAVFASAGDPPYSFALTGTLPAGLSFDPLTGGVYGTPTTGQNKTGLNITVTDSLGATVALSNPFSILVTAPVWTDVAVTPATWFNAMAAGKRLLFGAGSYGDIDVFLRQYDAPGVQLVGGAGVTIGYINLNTCFGMWFKDFTINTISGAGLACIAGNSDRIIFDHLTVDLAGLGGTGVKQRDSTNGVIQNCTLSNVGDGLQGQSCTNYLVTGNTVTGWTTNGSFFTGCIDTIVERNLLTRFTDPLDGSHPDSMQVAGDGATRGLRVTLRWNRFERDTGSDVCQGMGFAENQDWLYIVSNSNFGADSNGIVIGGCTHTVAFNNFLQSWVGQGGSRILVRDGSDTTLFIQNKANAVLPLLSPPVPQPYDNPTNYTITGNTIIPEATNGSDTAARNAFLAANPLIP